MCVKKTAEDKQKEFNGDKRRLQEQIQKLEQTNAELQAAKEEGARQVQAMKEEMDMLEKAKALALEQCDERIEALALGVEDEMQRLQDKESYPKCLISLNLKAIEQVALSMLS